MLRLHNTFSKKIEEFIPLSPDHVGLYVCGPTVYDRAHLGNFRPVVVFDVLYRLLKKSYACVTYVRNITDVDDKIIKAADERKISIAQLTQEMTTYFHEDAKALKALPPTYEPHATHHLPEMIELIQVLLDKKHAYQAEGHILFHIASLTEYGELSHICQEDMIAGARIEVAPYKKDPGDFILWKPSSDIQPGWESPWGRGRPGWHLECSAMSFKHLGASFDIHGGGQDLIFPHHENERAQNFAAYGLNTFAKYWLHNGVLTINGEKMSKSLNNFITLADLLKKNRGETIRFALLSTHYRQPLNFTDETLLQAQASLNRLYGALTKTEKSKDQYRDDDLLIPDLIDYSVQHALEDDLNTPLAIAHLHSLAKEIYKCDHQSEKIKLQIKLKISAKILGFLQEDPQTWLQYQGDLSSDITLQDIEKLIQDRKEARACKDFIKADQLRDVLLSHKIVLLDHSEGTTWRRL